MARDGKKQVTGFNLSPVGNTSSGSSSNEGQKLNSCPGSHTLTTPAGDPELVSSTGGLVVVFNGTTVDLPNTPTA